MGATILMIMLFRCEKKTFPFVRGEEDIYCGNVCCWRIFFLLWQCVLLEDLWRQRITDVCINGELCRWHSLLQRGWFAGVVGPRKGQALKRELGPF